MGKWNHKISFVHFWEKDMSIADKSDLAAQAIRSAIQHHPEDEDLIDIIEGFEGTTDVDEFDDHMEDLYNWADDCRVWIATLL